MFHSVDVFVGSDERARDALIETLKVLKSRSGNPFYLSTAQRGQWNGSKILRILTPNAQEISDYIMEDFYLSPSFGHVERDFLCNLHETEIDARRSLDYLPDYDAKDGYQEFEL